MPYALRVADLVVARCGANTLSEIAALKKPAILIPLPSSASNHQFYNAQIFLENKAALVLEEDKITPKKLNKARIFQK
jgi:UDP-N-acetylglucosamine--N-acetylmuramyl-(pentapeptide) pyrophosphoryl-undecaprenol N-acetylglucosamine transferase